MNIDRNHFGPEKFTPEVDGNYQGSRFSEVRKALFEGRYYESWGAPDTPPLPTLGVRLGHALRGILPFSGGWRFQQAAHRTVQSDADLRWGPDKKGFRRILHPNAVCLMGTWEIDDEPDHTTYTGYFAKGKSGLIVGRYSTCCSETRSGQTRSLSLVGKIYPTLDRDHAETLRPANFIAQEDIGGAVTKNINDAEIRNAPDVTPLRRGAGFPVFLLTVLTLSRADKQPAVRQLYQIAELDRQGDETRCPQFIRFVVDSEQPRIGGDGTDFRDEIMGQIYEKGDPDSGNPDNEDDPRGSSEERRKNRRKLIFNIETSDSGNFRGLLNKRVEITGWKRIGRIVFDEAVVSYNGDFVLHFPHPPWRNDRNDPDSLARPRLRRT